MSSRSHVLDDLPNDIKHYWLYGFILDWNTSHPEDIAKTLHHMATISKAHQQEVIQLVQNEPDIAIAYTAHAMRGLTEAALLLPPKKKLRARSHLINTNQVVNSHNVDLYNFRKSIKDYSKFYPTSCVNLSANERKEFNHPEWLHVAMGELLGAVPSLKRIRFDFSVRRLPLEPLQSRSGILGKNRHTQMTEAPVQIGEVRGSAIRIMSSIARKIKKECKDIGDGPVIELIIKNNLAALHEIYTLPSELHIDLIDASGMRASSGNIKQTFHRDDFLFFVSGFDLEPLSTYLVNNSCRLTTLILHDCNLDESALTELAKGLEKNISVKTLDLSKNLLCYSGIHRPEAYNGLLIFISMLATSTGLLHLNLANCRLRDDGAALFHEALKSNSYLVTLNLGGNMISHDHPVWSDTRVIGNSMSSVK